MIERERHPDHRSVPDADEHLAAHHDRDPVWLKLAPPPGWWDRVGYHIIVALVLVLFVAVIARLL